jgi:Transposase
MGALEPGLFGGRPCDLSGCAASANASMSFAHRFSRQGNGRRSRCEQSGWTSTSSFARRSPRRERSALLGGSPRSRRRSSCSRRAWGAEDRVALEVTGNAWEIKRIIEPHVDRVLVVSPNGTRIRQARAKTDRLDARTLARLLASGGLDSVWVPDRATWMMRRRLQRRGQLVWARSRAKNQIHATLMRCLVGRAPFREPFGPKGRRWLTALALPEEERESVDSALRQIEFLDAEIAAVERLIAREALKSPRSGG